MTRVRDLHNKIRDLNLSLDMNEDQADHTVGQYVLVRGNRGYQLGRIWSGEKYDYVLSGGFVPRNQLWNCIDAYMEGLSL